LPDTISFGKLNAPNLSLIDQLGINVKVNEFTAKAQNVISIEGESINGYAPQQISFIKNGGGSLGTINISQEFDILAKTTKTITSDILGSQNIDWDDGTGADDTSPLDDPKEYKKIGLAAIPGGEAATSSDSKSKSDSENEENNELVRSALGAMVSVAKR